MRGKELEHKRVTRELNGELISAINGADVQLRRCLVLMTALGYDEEQLAAVPAAMAWLHVISRIHENSSDITEVVPGVLP
jgi:hypothetical protein